MTADVAPPVRSAARLGAGRRRALRSAGDRRRHHRRRRRTRCGDPRAAHGTRRATRLRVGHVVEVVQARPWRASLPAAEGVPASSTRRSPSASASARPLRTWCACCRSSSRSSPATGLINPKVARALGSAMWMYDLTGGAAHRQAAQAAHQGRGAGPHADHAGRSSGAPRTSTTTRRPTTRGSRSRSRAPPPHTAPRSRTTRRCDGFVKDADGKAVGAVVDADGDEIEVRAKVVVNATGVWADDLRALDEGVHPGSIRPAKGIHITVPWHKTQNDIAAVIPGPKDRRSLFVVPWGDLAYVGHDRHRLRRTARRSAVHARRHRLRAPSVERVGHHRRDAADILGTWAGLRPLVKDATSERTADLSRRHAVRRSPSGVVTITGGKLTTYRRMAADTVDEVAEMLDIRRRSSTKHVVLLGGDGFDADRPRQRPRRAPRVALRHRGRGRRAARRRRPRPGPTARARPVPTCEPRRSTPFATRWHARSTTS